MATHKIAQGIAQLGRNGDSTLVHMQPQEVAGLQAIAKANGTSLTINPETGLPEAFSLGGFFKSLAPTLAGAMVSMIPGMQPFGLSAMQAGILAGAGTGALLNKKNPLMGAAMGGLGGYGGVNIANAATKFNPAAVDMADDAARMAGVDKTIAAVNTPGMPVSPTADTLHAGAGQGYYGGTSGLFQGPTIESTGLTAGGYGAVEPTFGSNLSQAASNVAANPLGFVKQNAIPLATTLGGAALGGVEASDIYGNPIVPKKRIIPSLNLNDGTALNLNTNYPTYAMGGPVSFADGGDSNKEELSLDPVGLPGGGAEAMQGAGQFEVTPGGTKLGIFATAEQIDAAKKADELAMAAKGQGLPSLGIGTGLDRGGNQGMGGFNRMYGGMGGTNPTAPTMATLGTMGRTAETAVPKYNYLERLNLNNKQYAQGGTVAQGGMQDLYSTSDNLAPPQLSQDGYGLGRLNAMAQGGAMGYAKGGYLDGPGDGMSDSIPATIEGKQPARLADGEFVIPADVVSHLGNGSTKAGSQRLYGMLDKVRKARTGTKKQGKKINPNKFMPA